MLHEIDIKLLPAEAKDEAIIRSKVAGKLQLREDQIQELRVLRRSVDARGQPAPLFVKSSGIHWRILTRPNLPFFPNSSQWPISQP